MTCSAVPSFHAPLCRALDVNLAPLSVCRYCPFMLCLCAIHKLESANDPTNWNPLQAGRAVVR